MKIKVDWKIIWEAVKEPLREFVMAIIPGILAYLQTIPAEWAIILYFVIRAIDSAMHEVGKKAKDDTLITGITRF